MIFGKSEPNIVRFKVLLEKEKLIEDIKTIGNSEEQKKELYSCLDDNIQQLQKFEKIVEFLRGSSVLENTSRDLKLAVEHIKNVNQTVVDTIKELETDIETLIADEIKNET